jgi:flavin-dependent dehydrogenase
MAQESCEVIVVGGGPGGSTTAALLAHRGRKVLLLEKEKFPRFHIGESLLPFNMDVFRELGVQEQLEAAGFIKKFGAEFCAGNGLGACTFRFRNGLIPGHAMAYQVLRSEFDHILLKQAAARGADVREEHTVKDVRFDPQGVEVTATAPDGSVLTVRGSMLVDASGRGTLLANKFRSKEVISRLRKLSLFAHYEGGYRAAGEDAGNITIVRIPGEDWFWMIPLANNRLSVGLVTDRERLQASGLDPDTHFLQTIEATMVVRERLKDAHRISEIRRTSDFSYQSRFFVGDRYLMVGDAAAFLNPIFSAGVYIAMRSGSLAVDPIQRAFTRGDFSRRMFAGYERQLRKHFKGYFGMIYKFYEPAFLDLFLHPGDTFSIQKGVISALAGRMDGDWRIRWRMNLFYFLVWLQKRVTLSPRIDLSSTSSTLQGVKV